MSRILAYVRADDNVGDMECGDIDRGCDMTDTNTWKSAFNTGYDMGRADGIAEMEKEAQDLRHEVDDLKQKLVDLALDYGRMLRKMGG
jgi:hypothetical protein